MFQNPFETTMWRDASRSAARQVLAIRPTLTTVLLVSSSLLACGADGGTGLTSSSADFEWTVRLQSPFEREGAAAIELTAPAHEFHARSGAVIVRRLTDRVQVAAFRVLGGEISFTVTSAANAPPTDLRLLQVADERGDVRSDISGYTVAIEQIR